MCMIPQTWRGSSCHNIVQVLMLAGWSYEQAMDEANRRKYGNEGFRSLRRYEREKSYFYDFFRPIAAELGLNEAGKRMLVVGVNAGQDVPLLSSCRIVGIDPCFVAVEVARNTYPEHLFFVGFGEEVPFDDGSFDGYASFATVGGSTCSIHEFVKEMVRVLKPGSPFVITVACGFFGEDGCLHEGTFRDGRIDSEHWRTVVEEIKRECDNYGMECYVKWHPIESVVYGWTVGTNDKWEGK